MFESDFAQFFVFGFTIFKAAGTVKEAAPPPSMKENESSNRKVHNIKNDFNLKLNGLL